MSTLALTCSQCAAPLEVPAGTRFLTCSYCNARLTVQHSGNAVYTEVLQEIRERTEQIAEDVEAIKQQQEIEQLDRWWETEQQRFMISSKHGQRLPEAGGGLLVGTVVAVVFGIFWMMMAFNMTANSPFPRGGGTDFFPLFGLVFVIGAIGNYVWMLGKSAEYRDALRDYQERRHAILDRRRHQ